MKFSIHDLLLLTVIAALPVCGCQHRPPADEAVGQSKSTNLRSDHSKMSDEDWLKEHRQIDADLWVYREHNKLKQGDRGEWTSPPSKEEEAFENLWYFYSAALMNNADVSSYVPFMIEHRDSLQAVGASGCLAALDQLLPLYTEQQKLTSQREQDEFWRSKQDERDKAHSLAEDANTFGRLLLAYAERNSAKFGGVRPSRESRARYEKAIQSAIESLGIQLPPEKRP